MNKIIFINRYYKPDHSATAQLLTDLAEHLASKKTCLIVVTSRLCYEDPSIKFVSNDVLKGVKIRRIWTTSFGRNNLLGRSVDYLSFYICCFFILLIISNKNDTLVAKTDPPLISVIAYWAAKIKRAKLINWVQDLFPEVAEAISPQKFKGPVVEVVRYIRNKSLIGAYKNVVIGRIMFEKLVSQGAPENNIKLIPNWVVGENISPVKEEDNNLINEWKLQNKFIVGYSGNLGRAHDHLTMLSVIENMQEYKNILFLFIGGGAGMDLLKKSVQERSLSNIIFKPYQSIDALSQSLSIPHIHIITLQQELEGLIVPSKFYGVLSVNKPILYIGSSNGELGQLISDNVCGAVFESGDVQNICTWLVAASEDQSIINQLSFNSKKLQTETFNKDRSLSMWQEVLNV